MVKLNLIKVEKAIKDSGGILTTVAKRCSVSRQAIYDFIQKHPEKLQPLVDNEKEMIKDLAEHGLYARVKAKDEWAIKFTLTKQAKDRGYGDVKTIESTGKDGGPIETVNNNHNINIPVKGLSKEALEKLASEL